MLAGAPTGDSGGGQPRSALGGQPDYKSPYVWGSLWTKLPSVG